MLSPTLLLSLLTAVMLAAAEPRPRRPVQAPLKINTKLTHVSAARELPGGRVLITDAKTPALLLLDPRSGAATPLGSIGPGHRQYVKPGGLYGGPDGTTILLDRGQTRTMTISPDGEFKGTTSIAEHGTSGSSDEDIDLQRVDGRGFAYFLDHRFGREVSGTNRREATIIRFEPVAQKKQPVTNVGMVEMRTVKNGNMTFGRAVVGAPADGWGVAPDGRVAVVRAVPYRVEWHGVDGKVTSGPVVAVDPLPMTDADKEAYRARVKGSGGGASIGMVGGDKSANSAPATEFAATRRPFNPDDVIVSPDSRVWVMRTRPIEVREILYDVFDRSGARIDRLELPASARIVGFGPSSILVRVIDAAGGCELRKYTVK